MLNFILGIVATILIIGLCGLSYYIGTKTQHKAIQPPKTSEQKDRETQQKKILEDLNKVVNYDVNVAYKKLGGKQ